MKPRQRIVAITLALVMFISLCACTNSEETEIQDASNTNARSISQEELATEPAPTEPTASSEQGSSAPAPSASSSQESSKPAASASSTQVSAESTSNPQTSSTYTPRPKDPETLSAEAEEKIKADYVAWEKKIYKDSKAEVFNVIIDDYLGTYGGGEVIRITLADRAYLDWIVEENIAGYTLSFPSSAPYFFHKGTEFYSLNDAYAKGFLTKQDIQDIQWYLDDLKGRHQ